MANQISTSIKPSPTSSIPANLRQRQKSKLGCLTCRIRRKKCDEVKTICGACLRNKLTCVWPEKKEKDKVLVTKSSRQAGGCSGLDFISETHASPASSQDSKSMSTSALTMNDSHATEYVVDPLILFRYEHPRSLDLHRQYVIFTHFSCTLMGDLLRPCVYTGFHDHTYIFSLALQYGCVMDIYLACIAMYYSWKGTTDLIPTAWKYYSDATSAVAARMKEGSVEGNEDWLLVVACFSCMFERWQNGTSSKAPIHNQGAAQVLRLKHKDGHQAVVSPHERIFAESIFYNAAITSVFNADLNWQSDQDYWKQIGFYFTELPFRHITESDNSPLLGVPPQLYKVILDSSCLARRTPLNHEDRTLAEQLQERLNSWLDLSDTNTKRISTEIIAADEDSWYAARISFLAADILIFKVMSPDIQATHPRVRGRVHEALTILQQDVIHGSYWAQHYCWALAIVGLSVMEESDILFMRDVLQGLRCQANIGDLKRLSMILETSWKRSEDIWRGGEEANLLYGLDLLLLKDGLSSVLQI